MNKKRTQKWIKLPTTIPPTRNNIVIQTKLWDLCFYIWCEKKNWILYKKTKLLQNLQNVKYSFNSKFHQIAPLRLQIEQILQYYADYSNKICAITWIWTKMRLLVKFWQQILGSLRNVRIVQFCVTIGHGFNVKNTL